MSRSVNPFVVNGRIPAAYFCDREEEKAALVHAINNQNNVVLMSPRRMGKTSLVDAVLGRGEMEQEFITVFVDILHTNTLRELTFALGMAVFQKVAKRSERLVRTFASTLRSLSASFGYDAVMGQVTFDVRLGDIAQPAFTLEEIFLFLEQAERPCVVVIDEFQQITRYPEQGVEALLRTQIQRASRAQFIFSGSQRRLMEEMFLSSSRPFYQSARLLPLGPIAMERYCEFAQRLFREGGKDIDPVAIAHVYSAMRGVTLYLQRIMKDAYALTSEGERCDMDTLRQLIEAFVQENDSRFRDLLSFISEPQKELLYAIHAECRARRMAHQAIGQEVTSVGSSERTGQTDAPDSVIMGVEGITSSSFTRRHRLKSPSATQSAAAKLLELDILTREGRAYRIADPLLELWLSRELG